MEKNVQLTLDSNEAEEILVALYHRDNQVRHERQNTELLNKVAEVFEKEFGWGKGIVSRMQLNRIKVTVKPKT